MHVLPSLTSLPLPAVGPLAVAGLEAVGIAGYAALVVLVLRLAVRWAERASRLDADGPADRAPGAPAGPTPPARG